MQRRSVPPTGRSMQDRWMALYPIMAPPELTRSASTLVDPRWAVRSHEAHRRAGAPLPPRSPCVAMGPLAIVSPDALSGDLVSDLNVSLMRGTLDLLILKALSWGPRHGYGVSDWIEEATGTALLVGEGTLYPALHRLERHGWIEAEWGRSANNRQAKFYRLSRAGRGQLTSGATSWHRFVEAAGRALRATAPSTA